MPSYAVYSREMKRQVLVRLSLDQAEQEYSCFHFVLKEIP